MSEARKLKMLVVDDDRAVCSSIKLLFQRKNFEVTFAHMPVEALELFENFKPDIVLLDMNFTIDTSGIQGLKLLGKFKELKPDMPIILLTGWATVQLAVEGMKLGAGDFLAKPWENDQLVTSVSYLLSKVNTSNSGSVDSDQPMIIGESPSILELISLSKQVANTDANILITGESGTGKELIAELIHSNSKRANGPFIKTNLGGINTSLLESELFGHVKGAFTDAFTERVGRFTLSNGGTLFLDEIGELPLENQVKLLRVLQEKKYEILGSSKTMSLNARLISATNKDLQSMVYSGSFREDLYYRINLIPLHLPPLRERRDDIPLLIKHFVKNTSDVYDIDQPYIDEDALGYLQRQDYPGNIRQLKNEIERTVILNQGKKTLRKDDFTKQMFGDNNKIDKEKGALNLKEMEIAIIQKALAKHNHSISPTAKALGITRSALYRRLEKYNIPHES